jgi:hypothetical protein
MPISPNTLVGIAGSKKEQEKLDVQFLTTFFGTQNNMEEALILKTYLECSQDREQTFNKLCKLTYSPTNSSVQAEAPSSKRKRKRTDLENEPMSDVSAPVS